MGFRWRALNEVRSKGGVFVLCYEQDIRVLYCLRSNVAHKGSKCESLRLSSSVHVAVRNDV